MARMISLDRFKAPSSKDEPKVIKECSFCGEPIYDGQPFYKVGNAKICEVCIEDCKEYAKAADDN